MGERAGELSRPGKGSGPEIGLVSLCGVSGRTACIRGGTGFPEGPKELPLFFLGVVLSQVLGYRVPRSGITASYFQRSLPRQDYITYFKRVCVAKPRVARDISNWHHLFWLLLRPSGGQAGKVKRGPQSLRPLRRGLEC